MIRGGSTVTVTMPLDSAANTIGCIKRRMHDIEDYHEKFPDLPRQDDVMQVYNDALKALNEQVPYDFQQKWVRTEL